MKGIQLANEYISKHKNAVVDKYRLDYHIIPPVGWINDPNGLIFFGGKYHTYCQFNPYDTRAGVMYWGHFVSDDLVAHNFDGVAIAPLADNASVFSGGAIEYGGKIAALYTLHTECGDYKSEEVFLAFSEDGGEFTGHKKVFVNDGLPENLCRTDFRDPCPVEINGKYYVFVGGKDKKLNKGVIIVLGGDTLENLAYEFYLGPYYELGDMGECPSYFKIGGKDVLVASGCHVPERGNDFKNVNSSVFIVGNLNFEKGEMAVDFIREIDKGDAFYAPQFIRGAKEPVVIGWLEMWNKPYPTHDMKHGWVGALSFPRTLSLKNGELFQQPFEIPEKYLSDVANGEIPKCADVKFVFEGKGNLIIESQNGKLIIGND
ncbi:MAG: hypothetical protein K2L72_05690, partial [Clostridia bacterium]|nr:hypothetical protein [Clostridia bacterium]